MFDKGGDWEDESISLRRKVSNNIKRDRLFIDEGNVEEFNKQLENVFG